MIICVILFSLSAKFDLCSQPVAEELSVWLKIHNSGSILLCIVSIQIVIRHAINSRQLMEVLCLRCTGSSNLYSMPDVILYPLMLNSDASDLYINVGLWKTRLFMEMPWQGLSVNFFNRCISDFSWRVKYVKLCFIDWARAWHILPKKSRRTGMMFAMCSRWPIDECNCFLIYSLFDG